jgi:uncharacterized membrane protein YqgA involved in biofilm formation
MLADIERFRLNPSVKFEYKYFYDKQPTKYVDAINKVRSNRNENNVEDMKDDDNVRHSSGFAIVLGVVIGGYLDLDGKLNGFAQGLEKRFKKEGDKISVAEGFITATLIYCIGSMSIVGSMESALGNPNTIYLKSALDGITSIALASTLGIGVMLSSISVILYQGLLTLLFYCLGNFIPVSLITSFSMVGYTMVVGIGLNFILKDKIKVANMLPSLLIVIIPSSLSNS